MGLWAWVQGVPEGVIGSPEAGVTNSVGTGNQTQSSAKAASSLNAEPSLQPQIMDFKLTWWLYIFIEHSVTFQ